MCVQKKFKKIVGKKFFGEKKILGKKRFFFNKKKQIAAVSTDAKNSEKCVK
jgi:hypothetical protein